jgi:hypothetical protein
MMEFHSVSIYRLIGALLLTAVFSSTVAAAAKAQVPVHRTTEQVPLVLSVRLPLSKPPISSRGLLLQTGAGMLGGIAGISAVGVPLMLAFWGSPVDETLMVFLMGGAYIAGTTAGVHHAGRRQGMSARSWATAAGTVTGLVVSGAAMQPFIDDEGNAAGPAPLLVFIVPSMGGTAGYVMTRRGR